MMLDWDPVRTPEGGQSLLRLAGVTKTYGHSRAVHPTNLDVEPSSFTAILGPSGCGKSTLLRMIGGFVMPSEGRIEICGADVTRLPPQKRPTNMVFQSHGLFPHMTVEQNVGFGLSIAGRPLAEIKKRVADAVALVRLDGFEERTVDRLSGGQQQRVALARALVMRPKILLLDEPLSALDLKLRQAMQEELRRIHRESGGTFLYVTHDQGEAFSLADRLIVMNDGRIEQVGPPHEVYRRPTTLFAARFVGDANVLSGERKAGRVTLVTGHSFDHPGPDGPVHFVLRPEDIAIDEPPLSALRVEGKIEETSHLGASGRIVVRIGDCVTLLATLARADDALRFKAGDIITLGCPREALTEVTT